MARSICGAPPGIGVIPDRVKQLAPDAPMDSWDLLFKPENAKRIAPCGITMMDSAIDVIPGVLKYLGKNPDSTDPADLAAVEHTLMGIRRYIRSFASGGALEALATGQTCLALDYSGDVIQAGARAAEAKRGVTVRYVAPKEGAQLGFDMLAIPADAEHKDAALAFIDFVLRPEVMAGITNTVRYANAVPASRPMIRPELLADTNIFPTPEQMATFFTIGPVPQAAERAAHPDVGPVQGRALTPLLNVSGLRVRFGATVALDGLDLAGGAGELFVLLGGSGSGKTTLLRAIGGFVQPGCGAHRAGRRRSRARCRRTGGR